MTDFRQVRLCSETYELVTNLPDHPDLKVGNVVTLKDHPEPERRWRIDFVAPTTRDAKQLHTRWRVGGLF